MTQSDSSPPRRVSFAQWASRMSELHEEFAELMHDLADQMVTIDPQVAARFYQAADLTRIELANLRRLIPLLALANCMLFGLGMISGIAVFALLTTFF